jgi:hypothetical protein
MYFIDKNPNILLREQYNSIALLVLLVIKLDDMPFS